MSTYQRVKMYLATQYDIFEKVVLRSNQDKQLKESLDKCMNQNDFDFNLTSLILDYKERQRKLLMDKFKKALYEKLIIKRSAHCHSHDTPNM